MQDMSDAEAEAVWKEATSGNAAPAPQAEEQQTEAASEEAAEEAGEATDETAGAETQQDEAADPPPNTAPTRAGYPGSSANGTNFASSLARSTALRSRKTSKPIWLRTTGTRSSPNTAMISSQSSLLSKPWRRATRRTKRD